MIILCERGQLPYIIKHTHCKFTFEEFRHVNASVITITIKIQDISIAHQVLVGAFVVILSHPNNQYCSAPCDYKFDTTFLELQVQYVLCV